MRLSWYSNAPWAATGYGTQTAQVVTRMLADGHEPSVISNYGLMGTILNWDGITVYPGGTNQYSFDVIADHHRTIGADWLITLYDVWPIRNELDGLRVASWVPIDSAPLAPEIFNFFQRGPRAIAMSRFGQEELARSDIQSTYIPHAIDLNIYRARESDFRERLNVPADAFLVVINAQNMGAGNDRKSWIEMLGAFAYFARKHDDAFIYLHTHAKHPRGLDLGFWMTQLGMPRDRVRVADPTGFITTGVPNERMAEIYTAADVLLATSRGEGFGLPAIEAQACGTPVIVTDFSAQPELVGAGWKVPGQLTPYVAMGNFQMTPSIPAIVDALGEAYNAKGDENLRQDAITKAQEYDADKVYAEMWRPYLAELQAELQPPRKAMSKAAKRRMKKAA